MKKFGVVSELLSGVSLAEKDQLEMDIALIARKYIIKNPHNGYAIGDVSALAADIRRAGVAQPLEVLPQPDGTYKLLTGERRLTAIDQLIESGDWKVDKKIPCIVRSLADYENLAIPDDLKEMYAIIRTNHFNRKLSDADLYFESEQWAKIVHALKESGQNELQLGIDPEGNQIAVNLSGRTRETVAKTLHTSTGQIAKVELIRKKGIKEVQKAVEDGRLKIAPAYMLSQMNKQDQKEFMTMQGGVIKTEAVADFRNAKQKEKQPSKKTDEKKIGYKFSVGVAVEKIKPYPEATIQVSIRKYESILKKLKQEPYEKNAADINETEMLLEGLKLLLELNTERIRVHYE